MSKSIKIILAGLAGATFMATAANAGGFSRGTADTDILYEDGNFVMRAGVTAVVPTRNYTVNPNPALVGTSPLDSYAIPSAAAKFQVGDLACAGTVTTPYGGSTTFAAPTASGKTSEKFTVVELGATCGYHFDVGPGFVSVLGGVFVEQFEYELMTALGTTTSIASNEVGYRVGAAYSIPEIALRAQLMYRSGANHAPTGTTSAGGAVIAPASGLGSLPQSVELKVQSGIAPNWLAFGSIKWTDWSVLDTLNLNAGVFMSQNRYFYKDGWTVSAGIGHQFNDMVSAFGAIQWDQGVGTGWDGASDTWTVGTGIAVKSDNGNELRITGSYTFLSAAAETQYGPLNAAYASGHAFGASATFKVKF